MHQLTAGIMQDNQSAARSGGTTRRLVLTMGDLVVGQRMMRRLSFLEKAQWLDRKALHQKRDESVRHLVTTAYREVPFYQRLFQRAGVRPSDVRTATDLARLPVITKDDFRDSDIPITRATGQRTHDACSSGSTGRPFCIKEDARTAGWRRASFLLAAEWSGWVVGERQLQLGMALPRRPIGLIKDRLFKTHYASAYDLSDPALDAHLEVVEALSIRHLWGYPGALYLLAQRAAKVGWNTRMKGIMTWGDNLYTSHRSVIETVFGTPVLDAYGCAEGVQIAAQCRASRYHLHSLDVVVEYVDDDGRPICDKAANLLITRLHPGPTPLIRYQIGDLGTRGENPACECGRGFDVMESIQGRAADIITTPSGNRLIVHFFTGILEHFPEVDTFQVVQSTPSEIELRIVPRVGFSSATAERIRDAIEQRGASDLNVDVSLVETIPLTAGGKRRFVLSRLEQG
jgi:phenylacetate-CoA ligase